MMNANYNNFKIYSFLFLAFLLTTAGCKDNTTGPSLNGKITVVGKVINAIGNGIIGATVSIEDSIKTTDANGSFVISGITTPYDVKIIPPGNSGIIYKGLTTASPQLYSAGIADFFATLNVTIPPLSVNQKAAVFFTDVIHIQTSNAISFPGTAAMVFVRWTGSSSITGKIIVLVYTLAGGHITTYEKYGEKTGFTLNSGSTQSVTFTAPELTLNPGESTISGALTIPSGFVNPNNSIGLKFTSAGANVFLNTLDTVNAATFNYIVPTGLPNTPQFVISGYAAGPGSVNLSTYKAVTSTAPATALNIVLDTPPTLTTPPNAATNIDTNTNFTYSAGSGTGIYRLSFQAVGKSFYVITQSTTTKIPNLNSFGLGIGSSLNYSWGVLKYNGITSMDEYVSTPLLFNPLYSSEAQSERHTFTTIP